MNSVSLGDPVTRSPIVVTTSPNLNLTLVAIVVLVTLALMIGDVAARRAVTMLDVLVICPFFLVIGACTPVGQGIAATLGSIRVG